MCSVGRWDKWHMPVTLGLRRWKQKHQGFKASLGHIVSLDQPAIQKTKTKEEGRANFTSLLPPSPQEESTMDRKRSHWRPTCWASGFTEVTSRQLHHQKVNPDWVTVHQSCIPRAPSLPLLVHLSVASITFPTNLFPQRTIHLSAPPPQAPALKLFRYCSLIYSLPRNKSLPRSWMVLFCTSWNGLNSHYGKRKYNIKISDKHIHLSFLRYCSLAGELIDNVDFFNRVSGRETHGSNLIEGFNAHYLKPFWVT